MAYITAVVGLLNADGSNPVPARADGTRASPTIQAGDGIEFVGDVRGLVTQRATSGFIGVISDTQHGPRGGGNLHVAATTSVAGFMSAADKLYLESIQDSTGDIWANTLSLGSAPAASGTIRATEGFSLRVANAGQTEDRVAVEAIASNGIAIGDDTYVDVLSLRTAFGGYLTVEISGAEVLRATSTAMRFAAGVVAPVFGQTTTSSATGEPLSVHGQSALTNGGDLVLSSGAGATNAGDVIIQTGDMTRATVTPAALFLDDTIHLEFGASAASTGTVRLPTGASIAWAGPASIEASGGALLMDSTAFSWIVGGEDSIYGTTFHVGLHGPPEASGGEKVLFVADVTAAPTNNPVNGGFAYSEGGAGKWRGPSGTITTFGPAEPHCPSCGRDFVEEWVNPRTGDALAVCMPCLCDEIERLGEACGGSRMGFAFRRRLK